MLGRSNKVTPIGTSRPVTGVHGLLVGMICTRYFMARSRYQAKIIAGRR